MKKVLFSVLCFVVTCSMLVSCTGAGGNKDYTKLRESELYDIVNGFNVNFSSYKNSTVTMKIDYYPIYNFDTNKYVESIYIYDPTGCCYASYPIVTEDGKYPNPGTKITFTGIVTENNNISVLELDSDTFDRSAVDIDTTTMSKTDFINYIKNLKADSDDIGKTIRICGHYLNKSKTLAALTVTNGQGSTAATIRAIDENGTITFPTVSDGVINPVEIIGTLKTKTEANSTGGTTTYVYIAIESLYVILGEM